MLSTYQLLHLSRMNDPKEEVLVQNRGNDIDSIDEDDSPFLSVKDSDSSEEADANIEAGSTKPCKIKACNIKACKIEAGNVEADDSPLLRDSEADDQPEEVFNPRNTSSESDGNIEAGNDNADNTEADDDSVGKDENSGEDANVEDSFDGIIDGIEEALEASEVLLEELEGSFKESSPVPPPQESVLNWTLDDTPVKEDEKPEEDIETNDGVVEDDDNKDDDSTEEDGIRIYYLDDKIDEKDKIEEEDDLEEGNKIKEEEFKNLDGKAKLNVLRKYKTFREWREYLDSVWSR